MNPEVYAALLLLLAFFLPILLLLTFLLLIAVLFGRDDDPVVLKVFYDVLFVGEVVLAEDEHGVFFGGVGRPGLLLLRGRVDGDVVGEARDAEVLFVLR